MSSERNDDAFPVSRTRALRQVRAAQLRAKAIKWAIGKSMLGIVFLIGALTYALAPQRHSESSLLWMAFLLVLSTLNVGLGLRTFSRVRRRAARYWPIATALWGILATALVRILVER
jgi:heme/copper-type cytochrome/quinol oxidase subunit 3